MRGLLEELGVFGFLPVQEILEVVDEGSVSQEPSLGQNCNTNTRTRSAADGRVLKQNRLHKPPRSLCYVAPVSSEQNLPGSDSERIQH